MAADVLELSDDDRTLLNGGSGEAAALAMRIVVGLARVKGAARLRDVDSAHIDGCLYHGRAGLDFAERLVALGAEVRIPTTLNVGSLDLLHPQLTKGPSGEARESRRLMDAYLALGTRATWTCAPYQSGHRPAFGTHVAWAESNAIVFCNSVLGARTDRYGDFLDACAAVTGRVPDAGLHLEQNRRATLVLDCSALPTGLTATPALYPVLGYLLGKSAAGEVAVFTDLADAAIDEDALKALGATAASAGDVALFHIEGVTPEAPSLEAVLPEGSGDAGIRTIAVDAQMVRAARDALTTARAFSIDAVSLGTPHFSLTEFAALAALLADGVPFHPSVNVWVSTSRSVLAEASDAGYAQLLQEAGGKVLVDTCTYVTPVLEAGTTTVMTNSGKWAYYAPGNLGVDVVFGSLAECVASARAGKVVRDERLWS